MGSSLWAVASKRRLTKNAACSSVASSLLRKRKISSNWSTTSSKLDFFSLSLWRTASNKPKPLRVSVALTCEMISGSS